MAKIRKNVTMSDIANKLNVSTVTVSKALSGQKGVSEKVRTQILDLAEEMGYEGLHTAKSRQFNVGVLIAERYLGEYESFYFRIYKELSQCGIEKDCFTIFEGITEETVQNKEMPQMILKEMVDGIVVVGDPGNHYEEFLKENVTVPMVFVDFYDRDAKADCFVSDGFYGTYLLTDYLIQRGHKEIAYVGTLFATKSITDRYLGYVKALMENGIQIKEEYVIQDRDVNSGLRDGYGEFRFPVKMPTAFVCNCDFIAAMLVKALREKGIRVPEQVSVVGYDNYLNPAFCDLGITTYEVDIRAMAKSAMEVLAAKMSGQTKEGGIHIMKGALIEKDSVCDGA